MNKETVIFVTGVERSGSSIIAKIVGLCGAFTGNVNNMQENVLLKKAIEKFIDENPNDELLPTIDQLFIPPTWKKKVNDLLYLDGYTDGSWIFKESKLTQTWPIWHESFPQAKWVIVRRKTPDIIHSCMKTGYMKMFKTKEGRDRINVQKEEDGWLWWVHQYEERFRQMVQVLDCKEVWPERLADMDYEQVKEMIKWLGLKWNPIIPKIINPMFEKSRRI